MLKLNQIKIDAKQEQNLFLAVSKKLKIDKNQIEKVDILKKAIDARDKQKVCYVYNLCVSLKGDLESKFKNLKYEAEKESLNFSKKTIKKRPLIVGFGPAGMFSALCFARMGFKPIVIEQGKNVEQRKQDVQNFWNNRILNKYSNVQFGEGGAGTFSDGKLNTNLNNNYCKMILNEFVKFGADKDISLNWAAEPASADSDTDKPGIMTVPNIFLSSSITVSVVAVPTSRTTIGASAIAAA